VISDLLIVDDSTLHRMHAADLFGPGVSVRQAGNGQEGLAQLRAALPDLMLLDLEMPQMDGVQMLQHMARENLRVPVVVTSGKDYMLISSVCYMGRELGLPILGGLKKPLRREEFDDLISRLDNDGGQEAEREGEFSDSEIRAALDAGQFEPFYQPKVKLDGGLLKGAEVLARWRHPERGIISPGQFIPVLERCGWITELTMTILRDSLTQWQQWARHGLRLPLSVNLSPLSLKGDELVPAIEAITRDSKVPPRYVIFEITETAVADNLAEAIGIAAQLRLNQFGLSIDDFGTGFATIQQLTRFPFTELKIDQSLVTSVIHKPHLQAVFESVIHLAERLQLTTVAEGVETGDDLGYVSQHGCILGQGYLFTRPLDGEAFGAWVKQRMHGTPAAQ